MSKNTKYLLAALLGGYGEHDLRYQDCENNPWISSQWTLEDCHQANRRVEFEVLELE